jgi:hypothetical protein
MYEDFLGGYDAGFRIPLAEIDVERLEEARRRRRLTFNGWAHRAGVSDRSIRRLKGGTDGPVVPEHLYAFTVGRLARAVGLTIDEALKRREGS